MKINWVNLLRLLLSNANLSSEQRDIYSQSLNHISEEEAKVRCEKLYEILGKHYMLETNLNI